MDSKPQVLNGVIDDDNNGWITITKCSDDNDDEGYKGIVYLNDDDTFQRMMGGGPNSTWPYRSFESIFDQFRLNWNMDVKLEQPDNGQKTSIGEHAMTYFDKTKEEIDKVSKPYDQTPPTEEKENQTPPTEEKENQTPPTEEKEVVSQEETKPPDASESKQNVLTDWFKEKEETDKCKQVKVMKEEQGRHRVIVIQQKERERPSR